MIQPPPKYTLFPYTTLFRSNMDRKVRAEKSQLQAEIYQQTPKDMVVEMFNSNAIDSELKRTVLLKERSEEHTSELQSHVNLVCRLLLEKKKKQSIYT